MPAVKTSEKAFLTAVKKKRARQKGKKDERKTSETGLH
jgi:CelD/BcsL family acetyltransferase involved in cellulose biosynthesis